MTGSFVTLRPLAVDDAAVTLEWRLGERAAHLRAGARTEAEQRNWIAAHTGSDSEFNFIIEYSGAPVGMVALHDVNNRDRSIVMGRLLIGEPKRVGSAPVFFETELLLCDFAFNELRMHKIYGEIMESNVGMVRTRSFLGYHRDGLLRDHYFHNGEFRNAVVVSLLEDEYRNVCRPKLLQMITLSSPLRTAVTSGQPARAERVNAGIERPLRVNTRDNLW